MTMETRVRTAKRYFGASTLCIPPILLVCMAVLAPFTFAHMPDKGVAWKIVGFGTLLVVFILAYGAFHARSKHYEPMKSATIAIKIGVASGLIGGAVPTNMLAEILDEPLVVAIGFVPSVLLGALLPWWLVRRGRRVLWDPIDQELIDSGEDVVLRARGVRGLTMTVQACFVTLERAGGNGFLLFEDLNGVESVTAVKPLNEERRDLTGGGDEVTIAPGPALRVRFARTEWYFPVDNAEDVVRLLTRRAAGSMPADEDNGEESIDWTARRDRLVKLSIDEKSIWMSSDRKDGWFLTDRDLDELVSVTVTRIPAQQTRDLTAEDDQLTVTPGEALLIRFDDDAEWLFPIDKAEGIATLITRRVEHHRATRANEDEDQPV